MELDLGSLERAIEQLKQSLEYYHSNVVQQNPGLVLQLRLAAIQAFAYTYELSWKMLQRYLKMTEPNPEHVQNMTFYELIRTGCEKGLVMSDVAIWKGYRKARGTTSHSYNEESAQSVFDNIPGFLKEAEYLLSRLQQAIQND